ncbi:MAG: hypothetical protein JWO60_2351 [Frankiales bacterium]|nr:hypothetical protein [Frankiales bacterium]
MDVSTVSTSTGLLRVELEDRGEQWVGRLVEPGPLFVGLPAAVGPDRESVLVALRTAVRALEGGRARPLPRPASSDLCP